MTDLLRLREEVGSYFTISDFTATSFLVFKDDARLFSALTALLTGFSGFLVGAYTDFYAVFFCELSKTFEELFLNIGDLDVLCFYTFRSFTGLVGFAAGLAVDFGVRGFLSLSFDFELAFFGGMLRRWG